MGLFSCFGGSETQPNTGEVLKITPLAPEPGGGGIPSTAQHGNATLQQEHTKMLQLLEQAQSEINRLTSKVKSMESEQGSKAAQQGSEVASSKELARTASDPDQLQEFKLRIQQLESQLQAATQQAAEAQSQVEAVTAVTSSKDQLQQLYQQLLTQHQQTQQELKVTREQLESVEREADASAAAIDELYCQTAAFLKQQGMDVGFIGTAMSASAMRRTQSANTARTRVFSVGSIPEGSVTPGGTATSPAEPQGHGDLAKGLQSVQQELATQIDSLNRQTESLSSQVDALNRQVEVLKMEKLAVQQQYEQAFDQGQAWHEEVVRLQLELEEVQSKVTPAPVVTPGVTTREAAPGGPQPGEAAAELKQKLASIQAENVALVEESRSAREAAAAATAQAQQAQTALTQTETELAALKAQLATLHTHSAQVNEAQLTELEQRLAVAQQEAQAARQEADELRREVETHSFTAEGTAVQVDKLMKDLTTLRKRYADLEANMRMKDEMMALLQTQLAEVADIDLDGAVAAAIARPAPLPPALSGTVNHMSKTNSLMDPITEDMHTRA